MLDEEVADLLRIGQRARSTGTICRRRNEFIWFSERDNWGQLYLYDLDTGKLKNQITTGDGNVTQVLHGGREERA